MRKIISILLSLLIIISLLSTVLSSNAVAVSEKLFDNGFYYRLSEDNKATVTGWDSDEEYLYIPDELGDGYPVTAIGDEAFKGNLKMVSVNCEVELDSIGDYAFEACSHLKTVNFSGKIGKIGAGAFSTCSSLTEVKFNKNIELIGKGAFFFDKKLQSFGFPQKLENIGEYAFAFSGISTVVMNNKIKNIPERLFYGCGNLQSISLSNNLETIGDYAFANCEKLDIDSFPDSLDKIGRHTFDHCGLSALDFNGSEVGEYAFSELGDTLEEIRFSDNLKKVGKLAFAGTKVKSIELPDNVDFENGAFAGIITDNYSVKETNDEYIAADGVVYSKDKKTLVYYPAEKGYNFETAGDNPAYTYNVPESTENIAPYAFYGANLVTEVKMPDALKNIGAYSFYRAGLKTVNIPTGVKAVKEYAFARVSSAEKLDLGAVEKIEDMAFFDFSGDKISVKIPDTLKAFNTSAFTGQDIEFKAEKNYKVNDGVLYSADGKKLLCFPKSEKTSFTIPDGVEEIGDRAFALNNTTAEIHIPDSLKTIGKEALEYYVDCDNDYENLVFKDGICLIGNASKEVKTYADNHNIGIFSEKPAQNIEEITLKGNESADFIISGADASDLIYSSNDDKIASVSDSGKITGLKKGTTYVTAAAGTTYFRCKVMVTSDSTEKYTGFDDSGYYEVTPKTYELWRENYLKNNSYLVDNYDEDSDEKAMGAYQSEDYYMAMDGVTYNGSNFYQMGLLKFGENYEPMLSMLNHSCNTELARHKNTDSLVLYSGAEPYASRFIAGEYNTLRNLKAAKGKTFKHPEYVSTTLSPNVANDFYSKGEGIMYIIYAEKSALDNIPSGLIAAMHSDFEYEQLFAPGSEFEVIDAGVRWFENSEWQQEGDEEKNGYQRYVKLRLLGGKDTPDSRPIPEIKLSGNAKSLYVKATAALKPSFLNSYDHNAKYSSSNSKVAKINSKGKITAIKKGTATITVSNSETKTSFKLTVKNPKLNRKTLSLTKGKTFTLKIKGKVGSAKFKSKNKKIAAVTKKGVIKAKSKGSTVITVKTNGISLKCKVKVK